MNLPQTISGSGLGPGYAHRQALPQPIPLILAGAPEACAPASFCDYTPVPTEAPRAEMSPRVRRRGPYGRSCHRWQLCFLQILTWLCRQPRHAILTFRTPVETVTPPLQPSRAWSRLRGDGAPKAKGQYGPAPRTAQVPDIRAASLAAASLALATLLQPGPASAAMLRPPTARGYMTWHRPEQPRYRDLCGPQAAPRPQRRAAQTGFRRGARG